ncbi:MAG: toprim protein [uncultured bacterium]|nr:MAG: toprim protein [uncultured bacterium]HBG18827.1 hypothetical protein [Desulfobulbaceae bacterium]
MIESFRQAMRTVGIETRETILADGILHRFHVDGHKSGTKNGWYVLHGDEMPAGQFGCFRLGISETWTSKDVKVFTPEEKSLFAGKMKAAQLQRDEILARVQVECRQWCTDTWSKAKDAGGDHPYLKIKGIRSYGLKQLRDSLLVPLRNIGGEIHGIQFIAPDGTKKFKTGTVKRGNYFAIGSPTRSTLLFCEGYATGASLHECTGHAVAVCFDAGNVKHVAEALRAKCPAFTFIFCGDNDESGTGQGAAYEAALMVGGSVAIPPVAGQDFNDLHQSKGLAEVKACIEAAISQSANSANSAPISLSQSCSVLTSQQSAGSASGASQERNLSKEVISFIESDPAPFSNNDLYSELCARTPEQKKAIRNALDYQEKQGNIRRIDGKRGCWEIVEPAPEEMDLLTADTEPFKLSLPLEISDFVTVRPGGIILVSGSSNAGKTVFLLTVIRSLLADTNINPNVNPSFLRKREEGLKNLLYLNSEMSRQELVARIRSFGDDPAIWVKHVSFIERSHSFDRVVNPDGINLIDFLEVNEDFYMAGKFIADIHRKLRAGIAIIAMQKKQGHDYAKGGEMTLEKPRLAINLDRNEPHGFTCKITKAKESVDFTRNIQGMTRDFVITSNSRILPLSKWRFVNEKQRLAINSDYSRTGLPQQIMSGDRNQHLWPHQARDE